MTQANFKKDCAQILNARLQSGEISRREFITGVSLLFGATALGVGSGSARAQSDRLVYCNWGGDAIDAMSEAFGKPFTADSSIEVLFDGSGPTEGAVKAQVESGKPAWDLADIEPFSAERLGKEGLMEPIDFSIVDKSKMRQDFGWKYAASTYYYSYVIAYDTTRYETPPTSMADFFDTEAFPGARTMYKWGSGMWEAALIADGVAEADLYPLDYKRANDKIAKFKDNVSVFWGGGAESQSAMLNGDASMGLLWNTRAMLLERDTEGEIGFTWAQGILNPACTGVLKNGPGGVENAMRYIRASQEPERQAMLFRLLGNGPSNPEADALLKDDDARLNPSDPKNASQQIVGNMAWYEDNYGDALDAYLAIISA
ncbi:ABC transporter substrate-binding protein [bacterium]|nr:ABC transporter substrate-binding protein [bacterium]